MTLPIKIQLRNEALKERVGDYRALKVVVLTAFFASIAFVYTNFKVLSFGELCWGVGGCALCGLAFAYYNWRQNTLIKKMEALDE